METGDFMEGLELTSVDRFRYRTRYFTDSGIIGAKEFFSSVYRNFLLTWPLFSLMFDLSCQVRGRANTLQCDPAPP